jgi:hypothetical protein
MESFGPVAAMIEEVDRLDKTLHDMGDLFESLPAKLRLEFEQSLVTTEKLQPEFRATLTEAQSVADSAGVAIDTAYKTTLQAQETAAQFSTAAQTMETAAAEVRSLLMEYRQMQQSETSSNPDHALGSSVKDYQQMADSLTTAAQEIRSGLIELQKPLPEHSAIPQLAGEIDEVVDIIFWRLLIIIAVVFILILGIYFVKISKPRKKYTNSKLG